MYFHLLAWHECFSRKGKEGKIYSCGLALSPEPQIWQFHVVVWQTTSKHCIKKRAAHAARLFFRTQQIKLSICGVRWCSLVRQWRQHKLPQICIYLISKVFAFCTPRTFLDCFLHFTRAPFILHVRLSFCPCAIYFARAIFVAAPRCNVRRTEVASNRSKVETLAISRRQIAVKTRWN